MSDMPNDKEFGKPTAAEGAATWPTKIYDQRYGAYSPMKAPEGPAKPTMANQPSPFVLTK